MPLERFGRGNRIEEELAALLRVRIVFVVAALGVELVRVGPQFAEDAEVGVRFAGRGGLGFAFPVELVPRRVERNRAGVLDDERRVEVGRLPQVGREGGERLLQHLQPVPLHGGERLRLRLPLRLAEGEGWHRGSRARRNAR